MFLDWYSIKKLQGVEPTTDVFLMGESLLDLIVTARIKVLFEAHGFTDVRFEEVEVA